MPAAPTPVNLPIVDFSACRLDKDLDLSSEDVEKTLDELAHALETYGNLYITNHGMDTHDVEKLRTTSRQFFKLPTETKLKSVRKSEDPRNGWVAEEMEYFVDKEARDLKECFNINLPSVDVYPWPNDDVVPGFRDANRNFMIKLNKLAKRLFSLLGKKYSPQDPEIFHRAHKDMERATNNNCTCMRNLYYPPMSHYANKKIGANQLRLSPHTDFGIFTFLIQDNVGGLEVQSHEGDWFEAVPLEGAIMIQAADMLERWTAGKIKAVVHRVNLPSSDKAELVRESTTYFVHPDNDFPVSCLDGSQTFPTITSDDYLAKKIAEIQGTNAEVRNQITHAE